MIRDLEQKTRNVQGVQEVENLLHTRHAGADEGCSWSRSRRVSGSTYQNKA